MGGGGWSGEAKSEAPRKRENEVGRLGLTLCLAIDQLHDLLEAQPETSFDKINGLPPAVASRQVEVQWASRGPRALLACLPPLQTAQESHFLLAGKATSSTLLTVSVGCLWQCRKGSHRRPKARREHSSLASCLHIQLALRQAPLRPKYCVACGPSQVEISNRGYTPPSEHGGQRQPSLSEPLENARSRLVRGDCRRVSPAAIHVEAVGRPDHPPATRSPAKLLTLTDSGGFSARRRPVEAMHSKLQRPRRLSS